MVRPFAAAVATVVVRCASARGDGRPEAARAPRTAAVVVDVLVHDARRIDAASVDRPRASVDVVIRFADGDVSPRMVAAIALVDGEISVLDLREATGPVTTTVDVTVPW